MDEHYTNFLTRPAKGGRFEYLVEAFTILAAEAPPPPWSEPLDAPTTLSEAERHKWARCNRISAEYSAYRKRYVANLLDSMGVPKDRHEEPEVREVFDMLEHHLRLTSLVFSETLEVRMARSAAEKQILPRVCYDPSVLVTANLLEGVYPKIICQDVVAATDIALARPGPKAIATFLNEEVLSSERGYGLEPDHVSRALNSRRRRLKEMAPRGKADFEAWRARALADYDALVRQHHVLQVLRKESRSKPDLKHLRGAELAEAIHERYDLFSCVERENQRLWPVQSAA